MLPYEISVLQAAEKIKASAADPVNPPVKLIDVREPWEVQTASVTGSILIPMNEFAARAHQELDPEDHLLILCKLGGRSLSVTNWLRQQGFDNAQSVAGGIDAWSRQIDPSIPRY